MECSSRYDLERLFRLKKRAIDFLGGKCVSCGYNKHFAALDFHHTDPSTKDIGWGRLRKRKWETIKQELSKCVLLCSNCHREHHSLIDNEGNVKV